MKKIRNYKELLFFKESIDLVPLLYDITKKFPKEDKGFNGLMSQIRRASVSVSSNIAEGSSRGGKRILSFFNT